jgi:hypothetical protein
MASTRHGKQQDLPKSPSQQDKEPVVDIIDLETNYVRLTQDKETQMSDDDLNLTSAEEFYVDIEALPAQEYEATVRSYKYGVNDKSEVRLMFIHDISIDQYPPDYAVDNAPDGTMVMQGFGGVDVGCGNGSQPSKRGAAAIAKLLRSYGYTGKVRFTRRDDLAGEWGVGDDVLDEIVSRVVLIAVKHNVYQGETRLQIASVRPVE